MGNRIAIATLLFAATATVIGQSVQAPPRVHGAGAANCEAWLKAADGGLPEPVHLSWVLGYLTAAGAEMTLENPAPFVHGYLNGFCKATPDGTLTEGARALVASLASGDSKRFTN